MRKACEGIDVKPMNVDDGVDVLNNKLKQLYAQNSERTTFIAYQEFERCQCKQSITVSKSDYINEFERLNDWIKKYGIVMPDAILAYRLLINRD